MQGIKRVLDEKILSKHMLLKRSVKEGTDVQTYLQGLFSVTHTHELPLLGQRNCLVVVILHCKFKLMVLIL